MPHHGFLKGMGLTEQCIRKTPEAESFRPRPRDKAQRMPLPVNRRTFLYPQ